MPSLRARMMNAFIRMTTKRVWREDMDIVEVRSHALRMDRRLAGRPPAVPIEDVTVHGIPATWVGDRALEARGTLLYLHGGAWCLHLPGIYRRFAARLSALTGMRVLLVDYRLAPEHPFPAATDDCFAAYRWLVEQGYAGRPLVVAGDSAGGSLTAVTLMRARDAGLPLANCAVLISPSTDLTMSGPSATYNLDADPMFSEVSFRMLPPIVCPGLDRTDPLLSPLFGNWAGLPPLLFHAGSTEVLLDDSVRAHDRARQAGVAAEIEVWWQMVHVFQVFHLLPEARTALDRIAAFIARHAQPGSATQPA
ncbi:MAG: alpha/beta hydrolase [Steroidobacteraceae bacterium]